MRRFLVSVACLVAPAAAAPGPAAADRPPPTRPVIVVGGTPPATLDERDLKRGKGRVARKGDELVVRYVGAVWSTGKEIDASWGRGPFLLKLGVGTVIEGWDKGLVGMREGGRRRLVIPPPLAYGDEGAPPEIGPGETLVFVVDLVRLCRGHERRCRR